MAPPACARWYISDPTSSHYGEELPPGAEGNDEALIASDELILVLALLSRPPPTPILTVEGIY